MELKTIRNGNDRFAIYLFYQVCLWNEGSECNKDDKN